MVLAVQAMLQQAAEAFRREAWVGAKERPQRAGLAGTPRQIRNQLIALVAPVRFQQRAAHRVARVGLGSGAWTHSDLGFKTASRK